MVFAGHSSTTVEPNKNRPISSPCFRCKWTDRPSNQRHRRKLT